MIRFTLAIAAFFATSTLVTASDDLVGYYYPEITSEENFDRLIRDEDNSSKSVRVDFVNQITNAQLDSPESPRFVFFAKGNDASTLILTALDDDVLSTLYRARAIMAQLTVSVRQNGFYQQEELQDVVTFYDLLQLMHFEELLITDGETWTHRVNFKR
ncbi:hypothetical protein C1J03_06450 [Sulfitobacter sp. SK012]|uniref:hypothetical protein n=1 Tax=Sulfitobacter sp. SK012 TaxID=1389005 RepID=UPI000E0A017E|nr:hypothetical protein [Sulfitobacter sp. SK012]AXI45702.1 hypothetical protein C1J03_06450 [Sulfitobacter sp. SK012]